MHNSVYEFRFARPYLIAGLAFGVVPGTCRLTLGANHLAIRFGPWHTTVAFDNIVGVEVTGPYRFLKTAGPPHLSLADRGVTFATNGDRGVCIRLERPVRAIEPIGLLRHPSITVTVADCAALAAALGRT